MEQVEIMMGICFMSSSLIFYLECINAKGRLNGYKRKSKLGIKMTWFGLFRLRFSTNANGKGVKMKMRLLIK